ncbi:MAG: hypothetical protein IT357_18045 [Gemmatimonadaceae bacterium]|nr:hypothetical protein [Gemmatimonadaceae bacterium]
MTDTRDDEKFEEFLQREAREINVPRGAVPRDAMWAAIEQARASRRGTPRATGRPPMLRYAPWIGMAATLLLGVGLGRFVWNGQGASVDTGVSVPSIATADPVATDVAGTPMNAGTSSAMIAGTPTARDARSTRQPQPSVARTASVATAPATSLATDRAALVPALARPDDSGNQTYRVASDQHLSRAEALVAVVAATSTDALMDSLTAKWARDILTNTRLLLDSPAGEDPVRRKLLEDLETVLVQLVQRSGRTDEDRAMLDRTLQRTQLLTRLRSGATGT